MSATQPSRRDRDRDHHEGRQNPGQRNRHDPSRVGAAARRGESRSRSTSPRGRERNERRGERRYPGDRDLRQEQGRYHYYSRSRSPSDRRERDDGRMSTYGGRGHDDRSRPQRRRNSRSPPPQRGHSRISDGGTPAEPEKPNFGLSGKLAAETNTINGVVVKYNEPPEARVPTLKWRLYVFKGNEQTDMLKVHGSSGFLFGRDRKVADVPIDHPSCSGQHAVLQFRSVMAKGATEPAVKPYIIDLGSTNGTYLNGQKVPGQRYVELRERDVLKFGLSTRDYVLLHDEM